MGIADFVLKYITIALKCLVVALPKIILAVKSKVGTGGSPHHTDHAGVLVRLLEKERLDLSRADVRSSNEQNLSR